MARYEEASHIEGSRDRITTYEIVPGAEGWTVLRDSKAKGTLGTRMAAFDTAVGSAMTDILKGGGVVIKVADEMARMAPG